VTLQLAVILSSVVGAILFFLSGYLVRSESATDDGSAAQEMDTLGDKITAYRNNRLAEAEKERGRIADLEAEIQQLMNERETHDASASQEIDALREEITTAHSRLAEAEQERARLGNLEKEIQQLQRERSALVDENRQLHGKWKEKARQASILWDEKTDLKQRLRQAQGDGPLREEQARRLKELESERNQLTIMLETKDRQISALEPYRDESARLSTLVAEVPHLRETVDQLKQENRELRSLGLVYQAPTRTTQAMPAKHIGGSMENLLEQFSEVEGTPRGAALADEHGLLVAGTSKHAESLAVTCALGDGLMTQVSDILPLGSLRQLVMVDSNEVTVGVYPFQCGSDRLLLASLSVGPGPSSQAVADFVSQASQLIDGVRSQNG
jgi:hypothetical protein